MKNLFRNAFLYVFVFSTLFAHAQQPVYKNKEMPIDLRVDNLLSLMTIDEKIAQIRHLHSYQIYDGQELNIEKLQKMVGNQAWGFVEGFPLTSASCATNMPIIQKYMIENTRLGIPIFTVTESLHGIVQEGASVFPQNIALGSTFDPKLAYQKTSAISGELHAIGMKQVLAPCIDVVRELRWGRVEESFGEDSYLVSLFAIAETKGYLDNGISPMLKHYGPHGSPISGLNLASVEASEQDVHEIYLKPFEKVVKNTPILAVMSSYNTWNREPNSSSHYLMTEILREKWGFKGYIYSDWGAISMLKGFHRTAKDNEEAARNAISAGLDVEASSNCYPTIPKQIEEGRMDVKILDTAVRRVLYAKFASGLFDDPYGQNYNVKKEIHSDESIALSRKIADESVVMLKNENNLLPLDINKLKSIAVIGPNANQIQFGDYSWTRDNKYGVTPLQGIQNWAKDDVKINYAPGASLVSLDESQIAEAVEAAKNSDISIVFCGSASAALARDYKSSTSGEGFDLSDLNFTGAQPQLIKAIHAVGKPVVLVLVTGKPFAIPWEKENIPAILVQWYAGEQSGYSIADILFGKISPSGRLTFSFPRSTGHLPVYYNHLHGDRGFYKQHGSYDSPGRDYVFSTPGALWSFGHGLTYTSFEYSNLTTNADVYKDSDTIEVSTTIKNIGARKGKEVAQLYISDLYSSMAKPVRELKGFEKILLNPSESKQVIFKVPVQELAILDRNNKSFVEDGEFEIQVGMASDNIILRKTITIGESQKVKIEQGLQVQKSTKRIVVEGVIRDVQATLIPSLMIYEKSTGKNIGTTNNKGEFKINVGNEEVLILRKDGYKTTEVAVDNQRKINIRMESGDDDDDE